MTTTTSASLHPSQPPQTATRKREAFRRLLEGDACIRPATTFDPLSAMAAQELGYPVGMLAGSIASLCVLGAPDVALLTLSELVEQARRICRACDLPLMVDGDHGYGNALNVRRSVIDLEAAGISALTLEDTLLPAAFGAGQTGQLIPIAEANGKLRAALDARIDPALVVVGRTHAGLVSGRAELLERQTAFQATGIDALFVTGMQEPADLDAMAAQATVPLMLGSAVPGMTPVEMAARGVRICLQGHAAFFDAIKALYSNLSLLRQGEPGAAQNPQELVKRLSRHDLHATWGADFLR